jgi:hypothetical protein
MSISIVARFFLLCIAIIFPLAASNGEGNGCKVEVPKERFMDFFSQMRPQPVFRDGKNVGVRIYEKSKPGVLPELGLRSGDLVTHFCGVEIREALSAEAPVCCKTAEPIRNEVELTVERDGKIIRVMALMPNNAFKVDAAKATQP